MGLNLHKVLYLYHTASKFYIQPITQPNEALIIDRQTCSMSLDTAFSPATVPANATSCLIYGIVGIKHLLSGPYLIVITKASQVGEVYGEPIYCMDQAQIIPFDRSQDEPNVHPGGTNDSNATYLSMLDSALKVPNYYFSYTYDLTNSIQRARDPDSRGYDARFIWNNHLLNDFKQHGDGFYLYELPLIHGFVSINRVSLGYGPMSWTVISRRSTRRAGTRFNCRGIDHDGNVANFVETEQILEGPAAIIASFVQIRGSIPLIWNQRVNYQYKPPIEIEVDHDHETPMRKHVEELRNIYGEITMVCLIDQTGHEGELARHFAFNIGNLQKYYKIPYHYFDFHKECSKMRWHRLSILLDRVRSEIDSYGFFLSEGGKVSRTQTGVIRSNCIDSLDRTNVIQSMVAQYILEIQLSHFKSMPNCVRLSAFPDFIDVFKNVWADNADFLSIQYAGTPALKTDFTRTGRRTRMGLVRDGMNSLTRYVSNNFLDDYRQDSIDLLLGQFDGSASPRYRPMDLSSYTSPLPVTIVMLTLVILYFYVRMN